MRLSQMAFTTMVLIVLGALPALTAEATVRTDQLLPATTKGYLSTDDVDRVEADFDKTQVGQLMADPVMKPFAEDIKRQLQAKWRKANQPLGLTVDDMKGVPTGEVAVARIQPAKDKVAIAVIADVKGNLDEATKLLEKVDANLKAKAATLSKQNVGGVELRIYTHTAGDSRGKKAIFFIEPKHEQLVLTDSLSEAQAIMARFSGKRKDTLASVEAYQVAMKRCADQQGKEAPHLRWFVEPFGFVEAGRVANPSRDLGKGQDMLKILSQEGFTAVQGIGGHITMNDGKHDVLHRTWVHAPAVKRKAGDTNKDKYDLSMRMLKFPNGGNHTPPNWIPRDLATFVSLNADLRNGFEYSKTLVNRLAKDNIFEDVLESLEKDPNGPRVNVRKEVVANLGEHVMVLTDYELPITADSERMLFCVKLTDVDPVRKAVDKTMDNDPNARRKQFRKHVIWEIVEEEEEVDPLEIDFQFDVPVAEDAAADDKKSLPTSAVTVAYGHLMVGSHVDLILKVLKEAERRQTLDGSVDFQLVRKALVDLGMSDYCTESFSRTDEAFRCTYELLRQGKMPDSKSIMGRLLNQVFDDDDDETVREQQIDASKLPEYQRVRRYLGPAGIFVISHDDGWMATGCFLSKETLQVVLKTE